MKKILISIMIGLLVFPTTLVNAQSMNKGQNKAKALSNCIEAKTGIADIVKSKLDEDIYNDSVKIKLPDNGTNAVKISDLDSEKDSLEIILPKEVKNTTPEISKNGTITYTNETSEDANIALQPTKDGIRSLITINNSSASKEYTFVFNIPKSSKLITAKEYLGSEFDTKEVYVLNKDNIITSIIDPAWAKDANGSNVPTYYRVEGNKLIQVVEFTKNNAFPIVADPNWAKIAKCAGSIALALGSGLFLGAKLIKIKKYIKIIGGVKKTAKLLVTAGATWEARMNAGGYALVALAAELTGIGDIAENCF